MQHQRILILDFGAQYTQLIARRVREAKVYCEIHPHDVSDGFVREFAPQGVILSGSHMSAYEEATGRAPKAAFELGVPVLGICYGMQTMAQQLGGRVEAGKVREFGYAEVRARGHTRLLDGIEDFRTAEGHGMLKVWMSHGDKVAALPAGFKLMASTEACPIAGMADESRRFYGVQFHPEVVHTPRGHELLASFAHRVAGCASDWTMAAFRAYLAIVGVGPGPSKTGLPMLDEMGKPKTFKKTAERPKLGKALQLGKYDEANAHLLVCDGPASGSVWEMVDGEPGIEPIAASFIDYIESWIGSGAPEALLCLGCRVPLEVQDLEREFCQNCGQRRSSVGSERSEASRAFEVLAKALVEELVEQEFLEIEDPDMLSPLVAALTEYMSEKGHKWKSPDRAAASIAGWLLHRDEVAELHRVHRRQLQRAAHDRPEHRGNQEQQDEFERGGHAPRPAAPSLVCPIV